LNIRAQLKSGAGKLYEQIALLMRKRIQSGAWPAGGRVPVLSELTEEFGVAVVTVRQALSILEAEGLIWRRQGKGTFVAERANHHHRIRLGTDWTSMIQVWATTEPQVLNSRKDVALPAGWDQDGTPAPSYRFLRRLHRSHETPYAVLNIYLDSELWRLDPERFDTQMIIPFLQDLPGIEIAEARQTLTISTADLEIAELLDIAVGTPVGEVRRRFLSRQGRILYSGLAVYRGDLVMLETVQNFADGTSARQT